ncbi:phosphoribosylglycinamide synthetase [Pseudoscardovia suis]|uniref:phosphoribosylglycinamide synthetase n=1 Tax=Pseudoscardovia suis TaxID=987063 RepID=UPI003F948805
MTYTIGDMRHMMDDDPKAPLRLSSARLSTVRYVFLVHIEDGIPSAIERAALEYADAILIGWPEEDAPDVVTPPERQYDYISQQFDWGEERIAQFRKWEHDDKTSDMADSLVSIADCIAAIRKAYQPEFLLPTFAEIRRVVEDEWNEDMDRIEAENKEAHPHVASDDAADDDADSDIRSHEDPSHDADPAKGGTER